MLVEKLPHVLMLQRKSIRMFPDGVMVGLYYSKDLKKYFTITNQADPIGEELEGNDVSQLD